MNLLKKKGKAHSSYNNLSEEQENLKQSIHCVIQEDCLTFLKKIPDNSIQLIICDPPYNVNVAQWDNFDNYLHWAIQWLTEAERILSPTGNLVIFGGLQYQSEAGSGDLFDLLSYLRKNSNLLLVNLIIWHYKNGMSAQRFFANRHEEIVWFAKSKKYYFDLDSVREPYDEATKQAYRRDKRLRPDSIEKGKNPTNVWQIGRLNANAKERVGHPTQKPREIIRRLIQALSYEGSTVLDFFAGSCVTSSVAIEHKRHSIAVDRDSSIHTYFDKQLELHHQLPLLDSIQDYLILKPKNFLKHPIFIIHNS